MPVWHVSVARLNKTMSGIVPVSEWPNNVRRQASELQDRVLSGVGGTWQKDESGEMAIHRRRRLSVEEIRLLHLTLPVAPVFTHGEAMKCILSL